MQMLLIRPAGRRSKLARDLPRSGSQAIHLRRPRNTLLPELTTASRQIVDKSDSYGLRPEAMGHSLLNLPGSCTRFGLFTAKSAGVMQMLLILPAGRRSKLARDLTRSGSQAIHLRRTRNTLLTELTTASRQIVDKSDSHGLRPEAMGHSL